MKLIVKIEMLKIRLLFFNLLWSVFFYAQNQDKSMISKDSIITMLDQSTVLIEGKNTIDKGVRLLNRGLQLAEERNDYELKMIAYTAKAYFNVHTKNNEEAQKYIMLAYSQREHSLDYKRLGTVYHMMGIVESYAGKYQSAINAYLKAEELFKHCNCEKELVDIYYNICSSYRKKNEFKNSILYGEKALQLINKLNFKTNRKKQLYRFIAHAYIKINHPYESKRYITFIDKDSSHLTSKLKADYFSAIGDNESAEFYFRKAYNGALLFGEENVKGIGNAIELEKQLKLKGAENKRILLENKLHKSQIQNGQYLFLLGTLIIIALGTTSIIFKRNAKKQAQLNNLIQEQYKEVVKANNIATNALKIKSEFLDTITHELKTPLNTIKSITYLMQGEKLTKTQSNNLQLLNVSSNHLLNLINDIIDLRVLKNKKRVLKKEPINVKVITNNIIDTLLISENKNNNIVHREIDEAILKEMEGDILSLNQILDNLIKNALKFTKEGKVSISVKLVSNIENKVQLKFTIADTGIGISKKHHDEIFNRFNQGSKKINRDFGGSGIGLAIVKDLLELHDSTIHLTSEEGKGTTIDFFITYKSFQNQAKSIINNKNSEEDFSETKILLVEDNKINQLLTKKILTKKGYFCDTANDGVEAVEKAKNNKYSLILMDIMMPKMGGFEATSHIRRFNSETPIIALTAVSVKANREKFDAVGIANVLNKPISPDKLFKQIAKVCLPKQKVMEISSVG